MEDFDYYGWRSKEQQDDYDPDAAPYEPLAPDLAGQSPLQSWRNTEARPSGGTQTNSGMKLRQAAGAAAAPVPTAEQSTGEAVEATRTVPTYWGAENTKEVNAIMDDQPAVGAAPPQQESYLGKTMRVMQQYASGVSGYLAQKAADVFSRSRGG